MRSYWDNLNERERRMLLIGSLILALYLLYALIYAPLVGSVAEAKRLLVEKQSTLAWMEEKRQQPLNTAVQTKVSAGKLLSIIAEQLQAKTFKKFPHQLQQTAQGAVELSFERVPYTSLLRWFWALENDYAITLKQFEAHLGAGPGLVKIRLIIAAQ